MQKVVVLVACTVARIASAEIAATPPAPPAQPPQPAPPAPEIAALGKQLAGKWTCTNKAKVEISIELDGAWIATERELVVDGHPTHSTDYRTYDAVAKSWTSISMSGRGRHSIATSLGDQHGLWTWANDEDRDVRTVERLTNDRVETWTEKRHGTAWPPLGTATTCSKQ